MSLVKREHIYIERLMFEAAKFSHPGLVIIAAADIPADLVRRSEVGRAIGVDRSIGRSIVTIGVSEAEARGLPESAARAEPARFTRRSIRSHRRKHDVGIHVAADYAPSLARSFAYTDAFEYTRRTYTAMRGKPGERVRGFLRGSNG